MNKAAPPLQPSLFDTSQDAPERPVVTQDVPATPDPYSLSETPPPRLWESPTPPTWADALSGFVEGRK